LTVEQVSILFESGDLSCFGRNKKKKFKQFVLEYNSLFNHKTNKKEFFSDIYNFRLYVKHLKLRAMYDSFTSCEAENAKTEFKEIFKKDFEGVGDLKLLTDEANRINDKILINNQPKKESDISFSKLVDIVESSRNVHIDRNIKLFLFKEMYDIELEKWNKAA